MRDRWLILVVSVVVMLATTVPVLLAHQRTPTGAVPSGVYYINAADWNVYYSYAEQVRQGHFLIENRMATDDSVRQLLPTFLVVGWVAKLTGLSVPTAFQLVRVAMIPVVVWLLVQLFRRWGMRTPIFGMIAFWAMSGFGRGAALPDLNPFTAALFSPHQLVAWAGFLWALHAASNRQWFPTAMALTLTILTIPFAGVIVSALCVGVLVVRSRRAAGQLAAALVPAVLYGLWVSQFPSSREYAAHNATLTLPPLVFVFGVCLSLPVAAVAWWRRVQAPSALWWLLAIGGVAGLTQLPYAQRWLFGFALPLAWFAGQGLGWMFRHLQTRLGRTPALLLISMSCIVLAVPGPLVLSTKFIQESPKYSMGLDEAAVITWARHQAPARWFTTLRVGQYVSGQLGQTVFIGHAVQTPDAPAKQALVAAVFSGTASPTVLTDTIRQHQLTRAVLPTDVAPPEGPYVRFIERFRTGSLVVYDISIADALVYSH